MLLRDTRSYIVDLSTQLDIAYGVQSYYIPKVKDMYCLFTTFSYSFNHVLPCLVTLAQICFFCSDTRVVACHTFGRNYLVNPACTPANNRIECSCSCLIYEATTACAVVMGTCVWCVTSSVEPNKFLQFFLTPNPKTGFA